MTDNPQAVRARGAWWSGRGLAYSALGAGLLLAVSCGRAPHDTATGLVSPCGWDNGLTPLLTCVFVVLGLCAGVGDELQGLLEVSRDLIYKLDLLQERFVYVSPSAVRVTGFSPQEFAALGIEGVLARFHPDDRERFLAELRALQAESTSDAALTTEFRWLNHEGVYRWYSENMAVLHKDGRAVALVGAVRDVTRRRLAQEALARSLQRFQEMADLLPDMLCECDTDLRLQYANRAMREAFGYDEEDLAEGPSLADLLSPEDLARARSSLLTGEVKVPPDGPPYHLRRKDGSALPCEVRAAPIRAADGSVTGHRMVLRDLSMRLKYEEAQRLAAVRQLAGGVAHQFNNLLAAMSSRAQLAQAMRTPEAYEQLVSVVLQATAEGSQISADLLEFARPSRRGRQAMRLEEPLESALASLGPQLARAGVRVERRFHSGRRRLIGDASQLRQVFHNLITNAYEAMPGGGRLTVETAHEAEAEGPGRLVAVLTDSGEGIPSEDLWRVFEPFYTTRTTGGATGAPAMGLGLSVARGLIEAHGGTITAHSVPSEGTRIEVRIPAAAEDAPSDAP